MGTVPDPLSHLSCGRIPTETNLDLNDLIDPQIAVMFDACTRYYK